MWTSIICLKTGRFKWDDTEPFGLIKTLVILD